MKSDENVREYIGKFFDIVDKLKDMEVDINDDLLTVMLLYSLPEEYENFRCAIESRDELPKPEYLKIKIIEENEARKEKGNCSNDPKAFMMKKYRNNFKFDMKSKYDKKPMSSSQNMEQFKFKCHRCQKVGHKAAECGFRFKKMHHKAGKAEELSFHSALFSKLNQNNQSCEWCLDSGCR